MVPGIPAETVPVDFWDLPPEIILLSLVLPISSIIGFPVELFLIMKLYAVFGYRKITRTTLFKNNHRNRIFVCIQNNPGISFSEIVRTTEINRGTLHYHLTVLSLMQKITISDTSANSRYFEHAGSYSGSEKAVLKHIRNSTDCLIFRLLLERSDLTRNELGEQLGLSLSTVSWRMKRLSDEKIIRIRKAGKNVRYGINPEMRQILEKYLIPNKEIIPSIAFEQISESG
jgi:predicted transcriptional regulator